MSRVLCSISCHREVKSNVPNTVLMIGSRNIVGIGPRVYSTMHRWSGTSKQYPLPGSSTT